MARAWYPVIDYLTCIECGTCIEKCAHAVYDIEKDPCPVVLSPESCIDHCHGCGNLCPVGAITYVGEDTGWMPEALKQQGTQSCCSCGCEVSDKKRILIEYLYLDLETCDRCMGTDQVLDEVVAVLAPALQLAGYEVEYRNIEVETAQLAEKHQFLSSPTIRVNGRDILGVVKENSCGCCSEISGTAVTCRTFEYKGVGYEVPPKEMVAQAIFQTVFAPVDGCTCNAYKLPENLKTFFEGKLRVRECSCDGCC